MVVNQVVTCSCFFKHWKVMESTKAIHDCVVEEFFNAEPSVRMYKLSEIKNRILKFHNFSLFRFTSDENARQIVHICDGCLKKFLFTRNFQFIDYNVYINLMQQIYEKKLEADIFRTVAPNVGCLMMAVEKKIHVSKICNTCQLHIMRCLYQNDVILLILDADKYDV